MSIMKLVIDNSENIKYQVLENLKYHQGKPVSLFCATHNIQDFNAAWKGLNELIEEGLVQRKEYSPQRFVLYRYRSELPLLRKYAGKSVLC